MPILAARYISPTGEKKDYGCKKIIKEKGGGNVLRLIERGLKRYPQADTFYLYMWLLAATWAYKREKEGKSLLKK